MAYIMESDMMTTFKDKQGNVHNMFYPSKTNLIMMTDENGKASNLTLSEFANNVTSEINTLKSSGGIGVGTIKTISETVPADSWTKPDGSTYYEVKLENPSITDDMIIDVNIDLGSSEVASNAGILQISESGNGFVKLYSIDIPTDAISLTYTMIIQGDVTVSNPNILINPDFSINQREQTSYTNDGTTSIYTVDRWTTPFGNFCVVSSETTGVKIQGLNETRNNIIFRQLIESPSRYAGKTLTLSFKYKSTMSGHAYIGCDGVHGIISIEPTEEWIEKSSTFVLPTEIPNDSLEVVLINGTGTSADSIEFAWAKLEESATKTPFTVPDIGTELYKCERFYRKVQLRQQICYYNDSANITYNDKLYQSSLSIDLPIKSLRNINSVKAAPQILYNYSWHKNILGLTFLANGDEYLKSGSNGVKSNSDTSIGILPSEDLEIDAEIY